MFGRTQIYTDVEKITAENVVDVLTKALKTHDQNTVTSNISGITIEGKH